MRPRQRTKLPAQALDPRDFRACLAAMKQDPYFPTAALGVACLALPWLNPVSYGPTHAMVQWLAACVGVLLCGLLWSGGGSTLQSRSMVIALAWLLAATASAVMGLLQYLGLAGPWSDWINYAEPGQAYANLRQRNQLATLLGIGLCALIYMQQATPRMAHTLARRSLVGLMAVLAATLAAADAASGSRTGMLQLLLLLGLAVCWRRGRALVALTLLAYALAAVLLPSAAGLDPLHSAILGRASEGTAACHSRLTMWSNVLHLIAQKPWWGWGWGELGHAHFMATFAGLRFCEILGNAHNLPLHLAVTLGLPLALLLCGLLLWVLLRARPWRETQPHRQLAWGVLAVMGLHSLLEYPLWYGPFQVAVLLAVLLLWPTGSVEAGWSRWRMPARAVAVLGLLVCAYVGWDYWRISQIYLPAARRAEAYRDNTLEQISTTWLFRSQVQFAELGVTPLTAENAEHINALAQDMLHFSPEASVAQKLVESALLLGRDGEAREFALRYQAAFPSEYAAWKQTLLSAARDKTP